MKKLLSKTITGAGNIIGRRVTILGRRLTGESDTPTWEDRAVRDSRNIIRLVADRALRAFDPDPDLLAMGQIVSAIASTYRRYQELQVTANASEKDITSSRRREVVTVLRARGPYSGAGGHRISMQ